MLWPTLIYLKPLFSRALEIVISKTQRPPFWFCLRTKNLFQMIFLNSSSQFISTRVTSDLSSLKGFPIFIFLKTRFTKWVTLILVWPCKAFPKDFMQFDFFENKMEWSIFTSYFKNLDHSTLLENSPLFTKYFKLPYLSFLKWWPYALKYNIESIWSLIKYSWQCLAINTPHDLSLNPSPYFSSTCSMRSSRCTYPLILMLWYQQLWMLIFSQQRLLPKSLVGNVWLISCVFLVCILLT